MVERDPYVFFVCCSPMVLIKSDVCSPLADDKTPSRIVRTGER